MLQKLMFMALAATVAACAPPADRLAIVPLESTLQLRPAMRSVMVRTVSLPTHAAAEEISFEVGTGLIASNDDVLWADDPQRAVTLVITRNLSQILGAANIGPEPWPFIGLPDVSIDIRVERMLAGLDGSFQMTGQYYVGGDGIDFPNTSAGFALRVPMADQSLTSIATAQAQALLDLSEDIARRLAR